MNLINILLKIRNSLIRLNSVRACLVYEIISHFISGVFPRMNYFPCKINNYSKGKLRHVVRLFSNSQ